MIRRHRQPDTLDELRAAVAGIGHWIVILAFFGFAWLVYTVGKKFGWIR